MYDTKNGGSVCSSKVVAVQDRITSIGHGRSKQTEQTSEISIGVCVNRSWKLVVAWREYSVIYKLLQENISFSLQQVTLDQERIAGGGGLSDLPQKPKTLVQRIKADTPLLLPTPQLMSPDESRSELAVAWNIDINRYLPEAICDHRSHFRSRYFETKTT